MVCRQTGRTFEGCPGEIRFPGRRQISGRACSQEKLVCAVRGDLESGCKTGLQGVSGFDGRDAVKSIRSCGNRIPAGLRACKASDDFGACLVEQSLCCKCSLDLGVMALLGLLHRSDRVFAVFIFQNQINALFCPLEKSVTFSAMAYSFFKGLQRLLQGQVSALQ